MLLLATLRLGSDFGEVNQARVDFCFLARELLERTCIESWYIDLDIVFTIVYSCNMVKLYTCIYLSISVVWWSFVMLMLGARLCWPKLSSITPHVLGIKGVWRLQGWWPLWRTGNIWKYRIRIFVQPSTVERESWIWCSSWIWGFPWLIYAYLGSFQICFQVFLGQSKNLATSMQQKN